MIDLHDWTFVSAQFTWRTGELTLEFTTQGKAAPLRASGVSRLSIMGWGPSVGVNEIDSPTALGEGRSLFRIQMQSGDVIEVVAKSFDFPPEAYCEG